MSAAQIIEGHLNEFLGKHKELGDIRLETCLRCPICNVTNLGPICDKTKWINKKDMVSDKPKVGYVRGCGCRLSAKVTIKRAHCVIDKW